MNEYEMLKQEYADGIRELSEDEYIGENGLPYCSKCRTPKYCIIQNGTVACPIACECRAKEIVNERYNARKPTVFTSNYPINDLCKLGLDNGIIDRILEMSTIVLKLDGDNFRHDNRESIKQLGIL